MDESDRPRENASPAAPLYRVFVPIDAGQKPTGGKVFVPEPFYRELLHRATASADKPRGWMILGATYRGKLAVEPLSGRLAVDTLRAQYELQVFGRAVRVRIPLHSEGASLLPDSALLDDRRIEPEWEPDGAALAFEAAEPGEYRLELALRPVMHNTAGPSGFDVLIPRVAASRFELALPEGAPAVEVPSACGATRVEKNPPRLSADLGPADRLTVRWQEGAAQGNAEPAVERGADRMVEGPARVAGCCREVQAPRRRGAGPAGAIGRRSEAAAAALDRR